MIQKISHIGIAVKNLQEQIAFYRDVLQLPFLGIEEVAEQKVKVAMFQAGEVHIELLEPTQEDSPIAKFMEKKGEGIHHIAYQVDNIEEQISHLQKQSVRMIDEKPRMGAHECKIAFVHPKGTFGVLTELCQSKHD
ncbi:MAG: methylmalonyl-CoA epimerase [Candidatus Brocadiae bacterium]|nr:methylmalonyl-CoA epimerase [Candidatus Brocadiia bacterium]